jgi:hypothetical protein
MERFDVCLARALQVSGTVLNTKGTKEKGGEKQYFYVNIPGILLELGKLSMHLEKQTWRDVKRDLDEKKAGTQNGWLVEMLYH